jgi:NADPH:quinone reductase-like Zn-dependent oxidoreductase
VRIPLPHIARADVSGEIVDGGGAFATGTRVMLQPGVSCGRCAKCLAGCDNECPTYDVLGYQSDGGYAELVSIPTENVVPIPAEVDFVLAAAFPLTFLTAWHMLMTRASLQAGEIVLVIAGGSGVGQAAIQIARLHGARVFATSGRAKMDRVREMGVDDVFDHHDGDYSKRVRAATGNRGADIVVEHVGEATWERSVRSLARSGRVVTCGATTGPHGGIDLTHLFARQLSVLGSYMGRKAELLAAASPFFDGKLTPVLDEVLPLAQARDAHERLESGQQFGKIVLTA